MEPSLQRINRQKSKNLKKHKEICKYGYSTIRVHVRAFTGKGEMLKKVREMHKNSLKKC